ncbi:MAG: radical SAM protein [Elusimicrobiota bacterium]|jgi:MoaA/NifB/PqqE/SkfB family radical SAM enzyme
MTPPRPHGRGGAVSGEVYPRLRAGALLRLRTGTACRQASDRCGVGRSGKVYELEPAAYSFLKACDGRVPIERLRRRFPGLFDAGVPLSRVAADIRADPTLSDLLELSPRPAPVDPRQTVEVAGLRCSCRVAAWHLVSACDLRCLHCFLGAPRRGRTFDERSASAVVGNLHAVGVEDVRLTGGEVTLRPRLLAHVGSELARHALPFSVSTNGAGDVSEVRELFRRHPDYARFVQVSVDGPGGAHDAMRGRAGAYRRTLKNLERLSAARLPVCVISMLHRAWLGRERELHDALRDAGIRRWFVEVPVRSGRWAREADRMGLEASEIEEASLRLIGLVRRSRAFEVFEVNQVHQHRAGKDEVQKTAGSPACLHHLGLLTLGERGFTFCSLFGKAFGPRLTDFAPADCGRARFKSAWNRIAAARIGHRLRDNPSCARCRLFKECQGGCPGLYPDPSSFTGCDPHSRMLAGIALSIRKKLSR